MDAVNSAEGEFTCVQELRFGPLNWVQSFPFLLLLIIIFVKDEEFCMFNLAQWVRKACSPWQIPIVKGQNGSQRENVSLGNVFQAYESLWQGHKQPGHNKTEKPRKLQKQKSSKEAIWGEEKRIN